MCGKTQGLWSVLFSVVQAFSNLHVECVCICTEMRFKPTHAVQTKHERDFYLNNPKAPAKFKTLTIHNDEVVKQFRIVREGVFSRVPILFEEPNTMIQHNVHNV